MDRVALPVRTRSTLKALGATTVLALAVALGSAQASAQASAADEAGTVAVSGSARRLAVFKDFRAAFDRGDYTAALPLASEVVALSEAAFGDSDRELVNPLSNLGATQYRLGDYDGAASSFQRSLALIDGKSAGADRQLIRPLQGLGETLLATGRHAEAAVAFKRAVDLSRNLDGLFNVEQLDSLDPLIECYVALDQLAEAEKENQYGFRVAELAFGREDPRLLEPLDRFARWSEYVGRYTTARGLHARALQLSEQRFGLRAVQSVDALRGLARTYYLEFIYGPEDPEAGTDPFAPAASAPSIGDQSRLNPDGERALRIALEALGTAAAPDRRQTGDTLIELGDWYLISGATAKALVAYRDGWTELAQLGPEATRTLSAPRRLAYRPPSASIARASPNKPEDFEERFVEARFTVGTDGKLDAVETAATDAPAAVERAVLFAVRKARYAPRLENGEPVETLEVRLRERVLVKRASAPDTDR